MTNEKIDIDFYIGMAVKWYWVVMIPLSFALIAGIYLVIFSQRYYEASTVILVQPQKVPKDVVRDIVAEDINTRVSTLSQRIRSRTNLEKIIADFRLFSGVDYEGMYMEDKIMSLRKRISVKMTNGRNRNADSFAVTYKGTDPLRVTKITQSLASYIIDENLKLRETQVLGTNAFLEDELESMRRKLEETETGLKEYRERYMGGLPEQLNSNLRILDSLNERLTHVRDEIRSSKYRLDSFEQKRDAIRSGFTSAPEEKAQDALELDQLKQELDFRLKRYTKYHPDVLQLEASIQSLEVKLSQKPSSTPVRIKSRQEISFERQFSEVKGEIALYEKEQEKLKTQLKTYKKRVEDTPKREQELLSMQRDYDNIRSAYHSILGRQLEAQIAVNMEKKQKGEQFRIVDPARVPQKPVEPNMKKIVVFVVGAGLGLGCALVVLLEFLFQTFRSPKGLEVHTSLPVIATIPTLRARKRDFWSAMKRIVVPVTGGLVTISLLGVFLGLAYLKG